MRRIEITAEDLEEYDVVSNDNGYIFEDIYDDVYGADEWVQDSGSTDVVGFILGEPVVCSTHSNSMVFNHTRCSSLNTEMCMSMKLAKDILQRIGDTFARVLRDDYDTVQPIPDGELNGYYEDESGIIIYIDVDRHDIDVQFFKRLTS